MNIHILTVAAGFFLDLLLGDPHWLYHPVRAIGACITFLENRCYREDGGRRRNLFAGALLWVAVMVITGGTGIFIFKIARLIHPAAGFFLESFLCYQLLAAKSLRTESMKVYEALKAGKTEDARRAVSMIVGRDTHSLTEEEITKATVETVAENTSDGEIAPLFYMFLGGPVLALLYKAVNTMDSMIGYKNDRYLYFGRFAAKMDDLWNLVPARLSAFLMIGAAWILGFDSGQAIRIYRRDRYQHKSPNSAQTEAACAGALNIRLAGGAYYFGVYVEKPTIGDPVRPVETEDIRRANRLLYGTAFLGFLLFAGVTYLWNLVW